MLEITKVGVLGISGYHTGPGILASLANFFGEQSCEVQLYDADPERLDLFARLAKSFCTITENPMSLRMTDDVQELMSGSEWLIVAPEENCAAKFFRSRQSETSQISAFLKSCFEGIESSPRILNLLPPTISVPFGQYYRLHEPLPVINADETYYAHQLFRWVMSDEYPFEFLKACERSALISWLNSPETALLVSDR